MIFTYVLVEYFSFYSIDASYILVQNLYAILPTSIDALPLVLSVLDRKTSSHHEFLLLFLKRSMLESFLHDMIELYLLRSNSCYNSGFHTPPCRRPSMQSLKFFEDCRWFFLCCTTSSRSQSTDLRSLTPSNVFGVPFSSEIGWQFGILVFTLHKHIQN